MNRRNPLIQCREISRWQELPLCPSGYFWGQATSLSNPTTCSDVCSCSWQIWKIMLCKETKPAQTVTNNLKITGLTGCPNCWQKGNVHVCNEHERWKPFPWCCSSTEAPTPTCGLTRWPVSREQGEYKKTVPTKAYFLKESLPRCCSRIFSYCLLKICKKLAKWSGKTVNFAFWIQKNCIHIYSAYLCIFLFIYLGPPRAKTAGLGALCMSHSHPSFFSVLWSQMALRPRILLLPSQLFLLGGNPA